MPVKIFLFRFPSRALIVLSSVTNKPTFFKEVLGKSTIQLVRGVLSVTVPSGLCIDTYCDRFFPGKIETHSKMYVFPLNARIACKDLLTETQ